MNTYLHIFDIKGRSIEQNYVVYYVSLTLQDMILINK